MYESLPSETTLHIVNELLEDAKAKEKTFGPSKANMQKEKCKLEVHVHSLTLNLSN